MCVPLTFANELNFSKPSVSVAMKNLRENGYILMDDQGHITLTASGQTIADTMYERHTMLSNWLIYLGVDAKTAAEDACRMEHVLSAQTFEASSATLPWAMNCRTGYDHNIISTGGDVHVKRPCEPMPFLQKILRRCADSL